MATTKNGVHGLVSGKLGNVIYYERNGIGYIRSVPSKRIERKQSAIAQLTRSKFKLVQQHVIHMLQFIKFGFQYGTGNGTAYNRAMSYNLRNAVKSDADGIAMDWNSLAFSRDMPDPLKQVSFSLDRRKKLLTIRWQIDENALVRMEGYDMRAYIMIIPSDLENWNVQGLSAGNSITDGFQQINILTYDHKITQHLYIAFASVNLPIRSTNSRYVGAVEM